MYQGDLKLADTLNFTFTSRRFTTGVPFTLAGTPSLAIYEDNGTTEITAGITLTVDFDGKTGLNLVTIVATGANGFETGKDYSVVIAAGTVDSVSVVGETVGTFSIEHRSALRPTVAGRTLDVNADGEAGIDWANIGSPTTVQGLNGTTVKTATDVEADTVDIQSRLPAALTGGGNIKADALVVSDKTGFALSAAAVLAIWEQLTAGLTTANTIGKLIVDMLDAAVSTRLAAADITLTAGEITVAVNNDKSGYSVGAGGIQSTSFAASAIDAAALATDAVNEIVAAVFSRAFSAGYSSLTFDQMIKVMVSALAGIFSGAATTTVTIRNLADSADVIVATVDSDGNRSAVTITP